MRVRTGMALTMILGGMVSQIVLAADPQVPIAPSSKWQVDYAPTECRLIRTFGEGKDRTILQISRYDLPDRLEMLLAGPHIPATERNVPVSVATSTMAEVPGMQAQGFASTGTIPATLRFRPDDDLPKAFRGDIAAGRPTVMRVNFVRRYAIQLDMGSMKGAIAALDKCSDDLIKTWGLDPAQQKQLRHGPEPVENPANWFKPGDYPAGASQMGMAGAVVVRLLVGPDGSVQNCAVAKSGGDKVFQDATCRAATARAKFKPAIAADGQPIASVWIRRINWKPGTPLFIFNG
ncbi:TonB family protein [uncultured Sphingomonas sp.]|uniref:TonB family protein n=1 Tax=uncultured Sphingomonas sp. TaxID=158754 RepID=UPI00374A8F42